MSEVRIELKDGTVIVGRVVKEDSELIMVVSRAVIPLTLIHKAVKIGDEIEVDGVRGLVEDIVDGGVVVEVYYIVKKDDVKRATVFKRFPRER